MQSPLYNYFHLRSMVQLQRNVPSSPYPPARVLKTILEKFFKGQRCFPLSESYS